MEIFNIVNDVPCVTPEGLYLPELKKIWKRDKTKSKTKAQSELAIIYHLTDPRSVYAKLADEERLAEVVKDYADKDWKVDALVEEAMAKYKVLLEGPATRWYNSLKKGLDSLSLYVGNTTVKGGKDGNMAQILAAIEKGDKIITALEKSEQKANKEIQATVSKLKGNAKFGFLMDE